MVEKIARQVVPMFARHIPLEDLVESGYLGLIDAVDRYRYDAAKRGQFERYAYFRIRGSIIDAHKRQACREEQHDSVEAIQEWLGFLPGALVRCATPLPDEIAEKSEMERTVALLIAELPEQDVALMRAVMAGASVPEASRALGRSPAWGRARLAAARDRVGAGMILR